MPKYKRSDGTEIEVRDMPTPHLVSALNKARKETKPDVAAMLEVEQILRKQACWEVRQRKSDGIRFDSWVEFPVKAVRYAMQQTHEEAWMFVKQHDRNEFFVAHQDDPL